MIYANDTANVKTKYIRTSFSFFVGFPFPAQSHAFKEVYKNNIGGRNNYYAPSALLSARFCVEYDSNLSFGVNYSYFLSEFRDNFTLYYQIVGNNIYRTFSEHLDIKAKPLVVIAVYSPVTTPYRSYVGGGVGVSFDKIHWYEEVNSNLSNDIRHSGVVYDKSHISPMVNFYLGILLNFDKKNPRDFLGALHFEVSINYIFRSLKIYEKLKQQYVKPPEEFDKQYLILPFYLSLSAGVSFNLFHQLRNK